MFAVNALHCLERGLLKVLELCSTVGFGAPNPGSDIESEKSLHVLNYEQTTEARFH